MRHGISTRRSPQRVTTSQRDRVPGSGESRRCSMSWPPGTSRPKFPATTGSAGSVAIRPDESASTTWYLSPGSAAGDLRQYVRGRVLAAGHGADDEVGLEAGGDGTGQRGVGWLMGQVLLAGEEPDERPPWPAVMIADGAAQHRVAGFQRVQDRPLRDRARDVQADLAVDSGRTRRWDGRTTRIMAASGPRPTAPPADRGRSAPRCRRRRRRRRPGRRWCRSRCRTRPASRPPSRRAAR